MTDVIDKLKNAGLLHSFQEFDDIVRSIHVVTKNKNAYRIDVMKNHISPEPTFDIRYWREEYVVLQPSDQERGQYTTEPQSELVLVHTNELPLVSAKTADEALAQALAFIAEH